MKLIVGLGNPGKEYEKTRHNAGFMAVNRLAEQHGLAGAKTKFHAGVLEGRIVSTRVMLMQPMTFMNRSGLAVSEAVSFFKLDPQDILVIVDDTALPLGSIRLRAGGSTGGHNGLADIQQRIGSSNYPRLRIGVGEPRVGDHKIPQSDYVLAKFHEEELGTLEKTLNKSTSAVETWLREGIDIAMTRFNTSPDKSDKAKETQKDKKLDGLIENARDN